MTGVQTCALPISLRRGRVRPRAASWHTGAVRIATWNVNGLRARLDLVLRWLAEREPDLVGLQELKLTDEQFPHDVFEAAGYRALVHGQKSWNGVAVLSRKPEHTAAGVAAIEAVGARAVAVQADIRQAETLAVGWAPYGIRVNDLVPGLFPHEDEEIGRVHV